MANVSNAAAPPRHPAGLTDWLFRPFAYIAGGLSLALGVVAILAAGLIGFYSNTHFDGVLDLHTGASSPLGVFLLEGLIDWLLLALVLFVIGKLASRTAFRALDLFGTQALARWPTLIAAAATLAPPYQRYVMYLYQKLVTGASLPAPPATEAAVFGLVMLVVVVAIIWMVALMYQSYVVCCNLKGGKAAGTFIGGLIVAEAVSKLVFWLMLR